MEERIARLEATVNHIQSDVSDLKADVRQLRGSQQADFRMTWAGIIAGFAAMAGILAKGFGWL